MTQNKTQQPISFFGKMLTFSRIKLATDDFELIKASLEQVSPQKDSLIPIVIDSDVELDLQKLLDLLWEWGLQPIGVVKGKLDKQAKELRLALFPADGKRIQRVNAKASIKHKESAKTTAEVASQSTSKSEAEQEQVNKQSNTLATPTDEDNKDNKAKKDNKAPKTATTASSDGATEQSAESDKCKHDGDNDSVDTNINTNVNVNTEQQSSEPATEQTAGQGVFNSVAHLDVEIEPVAQKVTSLVYDQMLRSGQSINHVGGDLILTNSVNDGAEAITDNSLHIYGRGMGRLVAGATGDQEAHIFCQQFNPSLVSVAGTYMLRDSIPTEVIDKPVQVSYKSGEGLVFRVMDDWSKNATNNAISAINHR